MAGTDGGFLRRWVRRLTTDATELDADELSRDAVRGGARQAAQCHSGEQVVMLGRLRSVEFCPHGAAASLQAELFDGTDGVTLIWMGRRRIPGIEPGRTIKVRGRIAIREGHKVLYNPHYELQQAQ